MMANISKYPRKYLDRISKTDYTPAQFEKNRLAYLRQRRSLYMSTIDNTPSTESTRGRCERHFTCSSIMRSRILAPGVYKFDCAIQLIFGRRR